MRKVKRTKVIDTILAGFKTYKPELVEYIKSTKEFKRRQRLAFSDDLPKKWEDFLRTFK